MAQVIKLKRSSVAGKAPSTSDLQLGEIAVNTADGKIYFEKNNGLSTSVQTILTTDSQTTGSIEITGNISGSSVSTGSFGHLMVGGGNFTSASLAAGGGGGGGSGAVSAVANGANNRIATFSSADALNGEANLTFNGSTLGVTGAITATGNISSSLTSTGSFGHLRTTTALFEPTADRTVRVVGSANTLLDLVSTDANAYIKFIDSNTSSPGNWFGSIGNNLIFYPNDGSSTIPILTLTSTSVSGSAASTGSFGRIEGDGGGITLIDGNKISFGSDNDGSIKHTGTNLQILETTGNIQLINYANDKDIVLSTDDGSGGTTAYITLDGSTTKVEIAKDTNFAGNVSGSVASTGSFGHLMVGGGNFTSASLASSGGGGGSGPSAAQVSGSWRGELSSSAVTVVGGGVSGSAVSTGSFGKLVFDGNALSASWSEDVAASDITLVGTTDTTTIMSGLQEGDVIIYVTGMDSSDPGASASWLTGAGYTHLLGNNFSTYIYIRIYYKLVTASVDTSIPENSQSSAHAFLAIAFRNVDPDNIFDVTSTTSQGNYSSNLDPASITTATDNAVVLALGALRNDESITGGISGYSDYEKTSGTGGSADVGMGWKKISSAGAEDPGAFSTSGTANMATATLALRRKSASTTTKYYDLSTLGQALSGGVSGSAASTGSFGRLQTAGGVVVDNGNISGSVTSTGSFGHIKVGGGNFTSASLASSVNTITALNNATANELVTVGATTTELDAEANLTFDGSTLGLTGALTATGNVSSSLTSTGSFGRVETGKIDIDSITGNWTNAGNTVADLGTITTVDINGGTIDGATIATSNVTVGLGKALDVSGGTLTLANDQISGNAINGGTIGSTTITTLDGTTIKDFTTISGSVASTGSFGHLMVGGGNFTSASLASSGGGGGSSFAGAAGTEALFSGSLVSSASFGKGGVKIIDSDLETQVITRDWDLSTVSLDKYMQDGGVSDEWGDGWGITASPDGKNVYVSLIGSGDLADSIAQYSLSGSWDIGSRTLHGSKSVATQGSLHRAMVFSPDGTKLITMDTDNSKYNEYDLTKPWDITTLTYVQNATLQGSSQQGITAKPDGSALYQIGENDSVLELGMTTAWDVSTISVTSTTSVSGDGGTEHSDIFFRPDGRFAYLFDKNAKDLHEWKLSTPWKFSTAAYTGKNVAIANNIKMWGNPEGTRLFGLDYGNERINQYSWNGGPSAHQTSSIDIIGKTGIGGDAIIYQNLDVHGKVTGYDAEFKGDISGSATSTGSFAHLKVGGGNFTSASLAGGGGGSGPSAAQVSGSWKGELSSSLVKVVGGGVSGSLVSTGSFGHIMVGGGNFTSASLAGGGGASNAFKTISVSGQSDVVADSATDTLTLVAGSNMTLTTSAGGDSITFASSGGGGGGGTNSGSYTFTQAGDSTSWAITHSLGTKHNAVTVYDDTNQVIIPTSITADDSNKTTIGFSSATAGYAVINSGGTTGTVTRVSTDGSHVHHQSGDSANWAITHSLNSKYPNVTVYDDSDEVVIPTSIKADSVDLSTITFSSPTSGRAVFSMGGNLSGSLTSTGSFGRVDAQDGFYDGGTKLSVPDYVFEPGYELKSIPELDTYISQSKHLPNVPDMNAIEQWKQISMGDRDMLLLEKIEELSLYIIQLNKRLEKLENKS